MSFSYLIPRFAIYALLIFTPLARASVQGWAVTVIHLFTLIALAAFLFGRNLAWSWEWIKTPADKPILALLMLCAISTLFSVHHRTSLWAMVLVTSYIVIFYLVVHVFQDRAHLRQLIWLIIGLTTFLCVFGVVKKYGTNPFPWWNYNIPETRNHLASTFGNRNHFAGYLDMAIPMTLGFMMTGLRETKLFLLITLEILFLLILAFTFSRGGWVSTFIGLFFLTLTLFFFPYSNKKKLSVILIVAFLMIIMIIFSSSSIIKRITGSLEQAGGVGIITGRARVWEGVIEMIKDHPWLGTGPGTFSTFFTQYHPGSDRRSTMAHNEYLQFISEVGLFIVVIMVWMVIALFKKGFKKLKNPSRLVRGSTIGAMSGIVAILVHSFVSYNLHIPANALLFTVLAAIVAAPLPKHETQT